MPRIRLNSTWRKMRHFASRSQLGSYRIQIHVTQCGYAGDHAYRCSCRRHVSVYAALGSYAFVQGVYGAVYFPQASAQVPIVNRDKYNLCRAPAQQRRKVKETFESGAA